VKRRRGGLSEDDVALWRMVASTVRPLRGRSSLRRVEPPVAEAPQAPPDAAPAPPPPAAAAANPPKRPPTSGAPPDRSGERRVRRGQVEIWGSLDLHGMTQDQARAAVARFVARAAAEGARAVIVVTGKGGRYGGGEGVLKRRFPEWLADPGVRGLVSGIAPAHARHGGTGASYVFLKRQEPGRDAFS